MTEDSDPDKIHIRVARKEDLRLFKMARRRVAESEGCEPEEIGHSELFRHLALYRLDNPDGVEIRLNGQSDTLLTALQQSDSDGAEALEEVARDALRMRQREKATDCGARYTGESG